MCSSPGVSRIAAGWSAKRPRGTSGADAEELLDPLSVQMA